MPRSGGGIYSLPATYEAVSGEVIEAQQHNDPLEDLEADANNSRPIVAGGTAATTAVGAHDNFSTKGSNVASAGTCDIGAATGRFVHITGTTTITSFGTKTAGVVRILTFDGILTLTHDGTALILPGGANITTAANDAAVMVSEGSGNWRCVAYVKADGTPLAFPSSLTLTGDLTVNGGDVTVVKTDDGATGVVETATHVSASPAASDVVYEKTVQSKDSAGNTDVMGRLQHIVTDPTSTSEDSVWGFLTRVAGTLAERLRIGGGLYMQGATDPGAGKINATEYQASGTALPFHKAFESTQQTITAGGSLTLPHSLGSKPKLYLIVLQCTTAELGFSIGDEFLVNPNVTDADDSRGATVVPDATNINIRFGSNSNTFALMRYDTGNNATITNANWRLVARAWA